LYPTRHPAKVRASRVRSRATFDADGGLTVQYAFDRISDVSVPLVH